MTSKCELGRETKVRQRHFGRCGAQARAQGPASGVTADRKTQGRQAVPGPDRGLSNFSPPVLVRKRPPVRLSFASGPNRLADDLPGAPLRRPAARAFQNLPVGDDIMGPTSLTTKSGPMMPKANHLVRGRPEDSVQCANKLSTPPSL